MALTSHREQNRERWVGVRPAHDGEQVMKYTGATNNTVIIYTVPAGKTLLLWDWVHDTFTNGAAIGQIAARDDADVAFAYISTHSFGAAGTKIGSLAYSVPIELYAGYDVVIISNIAGCTSRGMIHGILIPD